MNHLILAPILIPAVVAPLVILTSRFDQVLARVFSVGATLLMLILGIFLFSSAFAGEVVEYRLGNWPAEFGIVLWLDRLSATMILLSSILGFAVSLSALDGADNQGRNFHSIFLMQLGGINCAFLTADLFNLFVAFEVMLIASYGLMVFGGGRERLRAGIQFVVINLCGSSIFLIALGLIYAATGGLNMVDVGQKLNSLEPANAGLASCGVALLMIVFALKAGLFPFQFWLPTAYTHAPGLVAALFAIATKVGAYSILRVSSVLVLGNEAVLADWTMIWLLPTAIITIVIGMVGALASRSLAQMAAYATMASSGTLMVAISQPSLDTYVAGLYYIFHSTLAGAAMFLVVQAVSQLRPNLGSRLTVTAPLRGAGLIGGIYLVSAVAVAGMPPMSGFVGKLLILKSVINTPWVVLIWTVILGTSLLAIFAFARAGSTLFWKSSTVQEPIPCVTRFPVMTLIACGFLLTVLIGLTLAAGWVIPLFHDVALQLLERK